MTRLAQAFQARCEFLHALPPKYLTSSVEMKIVRGSIHANRYWTPHITGQIVVAARPVGHGTPSEWAASKFGLFLDPRTTAPLAGPDPSLRITLWKWDDIAPAIGDMTPQSGALKAWGAQAASSIDPKIPRLGVVSYRWHRILTTNLPKYQCLVFDNLVILDVEHDPATQTATIEFASEEALFMEDVVTTAMEEYGDENTVKVATLGQILDNTLRMRGNLAERDTPQALGVLIPPSGDIVLKRGDSPYAALVSRAAERGVQPYVTEAGLWSLREMESSRTRPKPSITHPNSAARNVKRRRSRRGDWTSGVLSIISYPKQPDPVYKYEGPPDLWTGRKVHVIRGEHGKGVHSMSARTALMERVYAGAEAELEVEFDPTFVTGAVVGIPVDDDDTGDLATNPATTDIYEARQINSSHVANFFGDAYYAPNAVGFETPYEYGVITDLVIDLADGKTTLRLER